MDKLTKEQLAERNGKDGAPVYVAANGKVYDVSASRLWRNGAHMKAHSAGNDLTLDLQAAPHGPDVLERFQQVAELAEPVASAEDRFGHAPAIVGKLLDKHPHPVSVHFPVALLITGAVFSVLALVFNSPFLDAAGFANVAAAAIMTPLAIASGMLSWFFNYGATWTSIYKKKAGLSTLLLILAVSAVVVRVTTEASMMSDSTTYWVYFGLVVAMAPLVMGIGYLGGKITFPS
jgi:predicted heme/steroid binding protein/uncharacterized membrane protein